MRAARRGWDGAPDHPPRLHAGRETRLARTAASWMPRCGPPPARVAARSGRVVAGTAPRRGSCVTVEQWRVEGPAVDRAAIRMLRSSDRPRRAALLVISAQFPFPVRSGFASRVYNLARETAHRPSRRDLAHLAYATCGGGGGGRRPARACSASRRCRAPAPTRLRETRPRNCVSATRREAVREPGGALLTSLHGPGPLTGSSATRGSTSCSWNQAC